MTAVESSTGRNPSPRINKILENAALDLTNAEFPGYLGKVFNPIREGLLIPFANTATDIVPKVAGSIPLPFLDEMGALAMSVPIGVIKLVYTVLPHKEVDDESNDEINEEIRMLGKAGMRMARPNPLYSSLMGVFGFATNSVLELVALPFSGHLGEWTDTVIKFFGFLIYTGIGEELVHAFGNPRAIESMLIIGNVQANDNFLGCKSRRAMTAMDGLPPGMSQDAFKLVMKDAAR